jgi:hypothetical protein
MVRMTGIDPRSQLQARLPRTSWRASAAPVSKATRRNTFGGNPVNPDE